MNSTGDLQPCAVVALAIAEDFDAFENSGAGLRPGGAKAPVPPQK
ncbi:MAG TPA: hypothetical protein PKE47_10325 [Verrucomicrobiota bacterium]|nr:hypothetical protein [Verrucomicrobiota bacterium]